MSLNVDRFTNTAWSNPEPVSSSRAAVGHACPNSLTQPSAFALTLQPAQTAPSGRLASRLPMIQGLITKSVSGSKPTIQTGASPVSSLM